jgi:hypothetical protein
VTLSAQSWISFSGDENMNTSATKMLRFTAEPGFHHGVELQF